MAWGFACIRLLGGFAWMPGCERFGVRVLFDAELTGSYGRWVDGAVGA